MKKFANCYLLIAICAGGNAAAVPFPTQNAPGVASSGGLIQNVQHYSTNPFWNENGPYYQRMPTPVYIQGTDLTAGECQSVVSVYVASECGKINNCANARLSDIRPGVMTQLSNLSGHNYVTACAGYIDAAFNEYVAQNRGAVTTTTFPAATTPSAQTGNNYQPENPYEYKHPVWGTDEWYQDYLDRDKELRDLQSQNGAHSEQLVVSNFPKTAGDLTFAERVENKRAGYEPWAGTSAYQQLNIESDEEMYNRLAREAQQKQQMERYNMEAEYYRDPAGFCEKNKLHSLCVVATAPVATTPDATQPGGGSLTAEQNDLAKSIIEELRKAF